MSDINSDLITQEVDEEIRRERMKQLWDAYGKYLIGLALGVVLLVGGRQGYMAIVEAREEASSAAFEAAGEASSTDTAAAVAIWQSALPNLDAGYKTLGQLRLAAAAAENGDTATAIASYDAIVADSSADDSLRGLAQLFAGMLMSRDGLDLDEARARLSVAAIKGEPWYFSALEQLALVDIKRGDKEAALAGYTQLVDDAATPQGVRARATQLKLALEDQLGIDPLASVPAEVEPVAPESVPGEPNDAGDNE